MAEEKTYVFGEGAGNNGILSLLGPMLSQRGVDPNVLLAMQGRNNDGFGDGYEKAMEEMMGERSGYRSSYRSGYRGGR